MFHVVPTKNILRTLAMRKGHKLLSCLDLWGRTCFDLFYNKLDSVFFFLQQDRLDYWLYTCTEYIHLLDQQNMT